MSDPLTPLLAVLGNTECLSPSLTLMSKLTKSLRSLRLQSPRVDWEHRLVFHGSNLQKESREKVGEHYLCGEERKKVFFCFILSLTCNNILE